MSAQRNRDDRELVIGMFLAIKENHPAVSDVINRLLDVTKMRDLNDRFHMHKGLIELQNLAPLTLDESAAIYNVSWAMQHHII